MERPVQILHGQAAPLHCLPQLGWANGAYVFDGSKQNSLHIGRVIHS
jgi:hypothetical protein